VSAYKEAYGDERVTSDPAEAGYFGVYLWKAMVEMAGSADVDEVRAAAASGAIEYMAPGGLVKVDPDNQHTYKTVRIGQITDDGLIVEVYASEEPVKPDPFLANIEWAAELSAGVSQ
jgi:urea transport system substrate-binding protein